METRVHVLARGYVDRSAAEEFSHGCHIVGAVAVVHSLVQQLRREVSEERGARLNLRAELVEKVVLLGVGVLHETARYGGNIHEHVRLIYKQ